MVAARAFFIGLCSICLGRGNRELRSRFVLRLSVFTLAGFALSCGQNETCKNPPTWSSIYVDYLGPTSKGTCGGAAGDAANCHLDATAVGSIASKGFVCGNTKESCYASFKTTMLPAGEGKTHFFEAVLRQDPASGCKCSPMPLRPASSTYSKCDLDRIRAWAGKGAPDD